MSTPRRICRGLLAADRPLARAGACEQDGAASVLLLRARVDRVALAADGVPRLLGELEQAAELAAAADRARVAVRFALGDALEDRRNLKAGDLAVRAAVEVPRGAVHLAAHAAVAGQRRGECLRPRPRRGVTGVGGQRDADRRGDGGGRDGGQGQLGRNLHCNDVLLSPWAAWNAAWRDRVAPA